MARNASPEKITHPNVIICEGIDAKVFLIHFLISMIEKDSRYNTFEVIDGGGNDELRAFMKSLPNVSGFSTVKTVTLIRDAEKNAINAEKSVKTIFQQANLPVPDSPCVPCVAQGNQINKIIGYTLFPAVSEDSENGTLEDLCLDILAEPYSDKYMNIADSAIQSAESQFGKLKRPHKNKLHTYISLTNEYVGLKLGESAKAKAFNFDSEKLCPLVHFLNAMLDVAFHQEYA